MTCQGQGEKVELLRGGKHPGGFRKYWKHGIVRLGAGNTGIYFYYYPLN